MKARYSFAFEFDEAQPETVQGEVVASNLEKLYWRAAAAAKDQRPNMRWRSAVCVLEKVEEE